MEVKTTPDTQVRQILDAIEKIDTKYGERLEKLEGSFSTLQDAWEDGKKRIQEMDDVIKNPKGVYLPKYGDMPAERMNRLSDWITTIYNKSFGFEWEERAADQEITTAADGGYLVPDPLSAEIVRIRDNFGDARRLFRVIPMTATTLKINTALASPSVGFADEDVAFGQTKATFAQKTLTAEKLGAIDELTFEVEQDAIRPLVPYLVELFGEAIAGAEDEACFTGTSPFTGIFVDAGIGETATAGTLLSTITYNLLVDTMYAVNANVIGSGRWLMHPVVYAEVRKLADTQGMPIFNQVPVSGGAAEALLGRPITLSQKAPYATGSDKPLAIYGDFRYGAFGDRNALSVAFSDHVSFSKGNRVMRVMERIAYVTLVPGAFRRLQTA